MCISLKLTIVDGHNDSLLRLNPFTKEKMDGFLNGGGDSHLDLPKALKAGLTAGFFAVFVDAEPDTPTQPAQPTWQSQSASQQGNTPSEAPWGSVSGVEAVLPKPLSYCYAAKSAMSMVAGLFKLEASSGGRLRVVRTVNELDECLQQSAFGAIFHFEGAEPIDADLDALEVFYRAGLRSLGIVWSRPNIFGCGVPFLKSHSPDIGPGLTDVGKALVRACNELGIMIDVSHLNEKGFWDVVATTDAPIVATHSCVHTLCPVPRNLTDKQLDAIKDSDGMVGLNFAVSFLSEQGAKDPDLLGAMVRHIDYLVERIGIDRVGFGSDFDGATIPDVIKDATGYPRLIAALQKHGYDEESLQKLAHRNWRRVLQKTWRGTQVY